MAADRAGEAARVRRASSTSRASISCAVVNSILDMSKIQSGTFALIPEPFAVRPLAEQCCDVVRLQAQNGRVEIVRDIPADLEEIVADRRACRQILTNLLSNAVKFTPEGGRVTLRVRPEGTALRVVVADTGIGIGGTDLARLGDPFFQAGSSLSRPYEGTGLGLSVVRGLVGLHGGTFAIESELGKGTGVTVRLPLDCRVSPGAPSAHHRDDPAAERHRSGPPVRNPTRLRHEDEAKCVTPPPSTTISDYASAPRERAPRKPRATSAAAKKKKGPRRPRFDMHRVARVAAIGMAATMALGIMVNALVLQKGHHPAPLFGKASVAAAAPAVVPRPPVRAAQADAPESVAPVASTAKARKIVVASRDADDPVGDDAIGRLLADGAPAKAQRKRRSQERRQDDDGRSARSDQARLQGAPRREPSDRPRRRRSKPSRRTGTWP